MGRRGAPQMTSSVVLLEVLFVRFLLLSSCSSLAFQLASANENSRLPGCQMNIFSAGEVDRDSSMNSWRGMGSLGANNCIRGLKVTPEEAREREEARRLGGCAVQRRRRSFDRSWTMDLLQTAKERLNESRFSLERLFHRDAAFFSNLFGQKKQLHHHAVDQQLKHLAAGHDDFKLHHVGEFHVPAACTLRQKLASIVTFVLEAMEKTQIHSGSNKFAHAGGSDALKKNLKYLMGDSMELEIVKQVCDTGSSMTHSSTCAQKFCDIFLGDPKTGILMVFSALKIHPLKAAMDPQAVVNRLLTPHRNNFQKRRVPSQADRRWFLKLAQTKKKLGHNIIHGVERLMTKEIGREAQLNTSSSDAKHKNFFLFSFNGGRILDGPELNVPCKTCLRREIFRWKRLTPKVLAVSCSSESATDPSLTVACEFVKENKFVATTMFAYDLRIWERAAEACKTSHNSCDFPRTIFGEQQLRKQQLKKQQQIQQQRMDHTRGGKGRGRRTKTIMTTTTHHHQKQRQQHHHHHPVKMRVHNKNKTTETRVLHHLLLQQHTNLATNPLTTDSSLNLATAAPTEIMLSSHDHEMHHHGEHDQSARIKLPLPSHTRMQEQQLLLLIRSIRYHHQHLGTMKKFASSGRFASFGKSSITTTTTTTGSAMVSAKLDQFLLFRGNSSFKHQALQLQSELEEEGEAVSNFLTKLPSKSSQTSLRIAGKFSSNFELFP